MANLLDTSPLLILLALAVISWFTGSRVVRLITLLFFFVYPLLQGKTTIQGLSLDQVIDFVLNTISYWLNEAFSSFIDYLKQKLNFL